MNAPSKSVFDASGIQMQRRMRFNPLRALTPEGLSAALDQFDVGYLWQAALLWDAMMRRDDTLSFICPQLENAIAGKPWGVFKRKNADPVEAARHAAALEYFYENCTALDAFDRNIRGDRSLLLKQMSSAYALKYAVHHFNWQRVPGAMIEVEGGAPVPAITAELELVPLWFFENTTGTLRFLPFGGFGGIGQECDWQGEWMVTTGPGMMFAASICYTFKRLTFQDWTIFNERYAQQKVIGQTPEGRDSEQGKSMESIVADFNGDQGIVLYNSTPGDKPPITLLGPEGTVSVDIFERFLNRQDDKMTVMFRGAAQANNMSDKKETGITAQINETELLELAHCANIASACRTFIDRKVIELCFGKGVMPLAYFGLPELDQEDAQQLRESAGFLADRGALVELDTVAERLGVTLTEDPDAALRPATVGKTAESAGDTENEEDKAEQTANAATLRRLQELVEETLWTANAFDPTEKRDDEGRWTAHTVSIPDEHWSGTPKEMHAKAAAVMKTFGSVQHEKLGEIKFTQQGRSKTLFDKRTPHEFQSAQALPALLSKSKWMASMPDRKGRAEIESFHALEGRLQIGAEKYRVDLTVKTTKGEGTIAHKFYLHRLSK